MTMTAMCWGFARIDGVCVRSFLVHEIRSTSSTADIPSPAASRKRVSTVGWDSALSIMEMEFLCRPARSAKASWDRPCSLRRVRSSAASRCEGSCSDMARVSGTAALIATQCSVQS